MGVITQSRREAKRRKKEVGNTKSHMQHLHDIAVENGYRNWAEMQRVNNNNEKFNY